MLAALVASLVLLIVAIQVILPPGSGGPDPAQATLDGLARAAASTRSLVPVPGSYLYVRSSGFILKTKTDIPSGDSWSFIVPLTRQKWLSPVGSGRILVRYGKPRFASRADRAAWRSADSPDLLPPGAREDFRFGPGELGPQDLGALPKDPSSLAALISSGGVTTGSSSGASESPWADRRSAGEVPTSPELRSSLFLATAELPGIESLGRVSDPSGRVGIGIAIVESGVRTELIFDTTTSALLSRSVVRVDAEGAPQRRSSQS